MERCRQIRLTHTAVAALFFQLIADTAPAMSLNEGFDMADMPYRAARCGEEEWSRVIAMCRHPEQKPDWPAVSAGEEFPVEDLEAEDVVEEGVFADEGDGIFVGFVGLDEGAEVVGVENTGFGDFIG